MSPPTLVSCPKHTTHTHTYIHGHPPAAHCHISARAHRGPPLATPTDHITLCSLSRDPLTSSQLRPLSPFGNVGPSSIINGPVKGTSTLMTSPHSHVSQLASASASPFLPSDEFVTRLYALRRLLHCPLRLDLAPQSPHWKNSPISSVLFLPR